MQMASRDLEENTAGEPCVWEVLVIILLLWKRLILKHTFLIEDWEVENLHAGPLCICMASVRDFCVCEHMCLCIYMCFWSFPFCLLSLILNCLFCFILFNDFTKSYQIAISSRQWKKTLMKIKKFLCHKGLRVQIQFVQTQLVLLPKHIEIPVLSHRES